MAVKEVSDAFSGPRSGGGSATLPVAGKYLSGPLGDAAMVAINRPDSPVTIDRRERADGIYFPE